MGQDGNYLFHGRCFPSCPQSYTAEVRRATCSAPHTHRFLRSLRHTFHRHRCCRRHLFTLRHHNPNPPAIAASALASRDCHCYRDCFERCWCELDLALPTDAESLSPAIRCKLLLAGRGQQQLWPAVREPVRPGPRVPRCRPHVVQHLPDEFGQAYAATPRGRRLPAQAAAYPVLRCLPAR